MNYTDLDYKFMKQTIELAKQGIGFTSPNPMVGCVIVKDGHVIGTGYHEKYGGSHAEVNAINEAKKNNYSLAESTIYINLEPCSHTNKLTPPCAPLLLEQNFKRVVIANIDPNPNVSGRGIKLLQDNGVQVDVGLMSDLGELLNEVFFKSMRENKCFVHLKMAQTLDGKIATKSGESKYITGEESLNFVHQLRQAADAIVVGKNTVLKDNPSLTVRLNTKFVNHPLRVIFINLAAIDFSLKVFSDEFKRNTMVITTDKDLLENIEVAKKLEKNGIALLALDQNSDGRVNIKSFLNSMSSLKMYSILLEGGPTIASSFLKDNLVDKVSIFTAPFFLGEGMTTLNDIGVNKLADKKALMQPAFKSLGNDFLVEGYLCSRA